MKAAPSRETWDPVLRGFGSRLRSIAARRGLSATELARQAGIAVPTITRCMKGERLIDLNSLVKLARALGMSLDQLLEFDPKEQISGVQPVGVGRKKA